MKIGRLVRGSGTRVGACGLILALSAAGACVSACGSSSGNGSNNKDAGANDAGGDGGNVTPKDGGSDGAVSDGGSGADVEPGDAGHDAGETADAGDSGSTEDGSAGDSGSKNDSGSTEDGSTGDSGSTDAGSKSDSGATDSGTTDSGSTGTDSGTDGSTAHTTLLVDNDFSDNNNNPTDTTATPSASDALFPTLLAGATTPVGFDTLVVPSDDTSQSSVPAPTDLSPYTRIVWYCGSDNAGISNYQSSLIQTWLDSGGKEIIVFCEDVISDLGGDWLDTSSDGLLYGTSPVYLGLTGGDFEPFTDMTMSAAYNDQLPAPVATGVAATPFAGLTFKITGQAGDTATLIDSDFSDFNPGLSLTTVPLVTIAADEPDPTNTTFIDTNYPVVIGTKTAGHAGTSKIVLVGMPVENINSLAASAQQFMNAALAY